MIDNLPTDNAASDGPLYTAAPERAAAPSDEVESTATESDEGQEGDTPPAEEKPKFKAWEHARQKPTHIPYERFHEVNSEKVQLRSELEQTRARLAELEAKSTEIAKVVEPEDLDPADFASAAEYLAARDKALLAKAHQTWEQSQAERQQQQAMQQHIDAVGQTFTKNVSEAIARNPEIAEAKEFFDAYAAQLHPQVAYELMIDENVGELMYDIATDQDLLTQIFRGNPADAVRTLHKMSARINRDERYGNHGGDDVPAPMQRQPVVPQALQRDRIAAGLPTTVRPSHKGAPLNVHKHAGQMTLKEYEAATRGKK